MDIHEKRDRLKAHHSAGILTGVSRTNINSMRTAKVERLLSEGMERWESLTDAERDLANACDTPALYEAKRALLIRESEPRVAIPVYEQPDLGLGDEIVIHVTHRGVAFDVRAKYDGRLATDLMARLLAA